MASSAFVQLASALVEAMGQKLDAAKPIPEGLALRTGDGFLYAFFEDPNQFPSKASVGSSARAMNSPSTWWYSLQVACRYAISGEVARRGGTLVEGNQFHELARQLGLGTFLGEEPRAPSTPPRRLLPSAQQLDNIMGRARTWLDWGVPALALRFYRQAANLEPEFLPARTGIGRALLALGLVADAERTFDEVLATRRTTSTPGSEGQRRSGRRLVPSDEIEVYRALLAEDQARLEVRAHLVAALVDLGDWAGARVEIEALLAGTPEDAQLRFLHGVALERTGEPVDGARERAEARTLGLPHERETALCQHLGLPPPPKPTAESSQTVPAPVAPPRRRTTAPPVAAKPARKPVARSVRTKGEKALVSHPAPPQT